MTQVPMMRGDMDKVPEVVYIRLMDTLYFVYGKSIVGQDFSRVSYSFTRMIHTKLEGTFCINSTSKETKRRTLFPSRQIG